MMRHTNTWMLAAAVSAALFLGAAATSQVQGASSGTPIVTGGGHWVALDSAGVVAGISFYSVSVVQQLDGTISGKGSSRFQGADGSNMGVQFDVVGIQPVGDELFVISRITKAVNAPTIEIGSWALLGVQDNGGQGVPDKAISSTGMIPSFVPFEAIQQIVMLPPPDGPPAPGMWFPLIGGNFTIH